ncbi:hypothetical protein ACWEN3_21845, partial [Streptomyces sp. NPDC004561]
AADRRRVDVPLAERADPATLLQDGQHHRHPGNSASLAYGDRSARVQRAANPVPGRDGRDTSADPADSATTAGGEIVAVPPERLVASGIR